MKKILVILMVLILATNLFACTQSPSEEPAQPAEPNQPEQPVEEPKLDFPKRAIEVVVPFGPGGSSDLMTREFANIAANFLDKPMNVVNRAGGGGVDGMVYVANAPADGYTLLQITPSHAIAEALSRPNASLTGDFMPIGNFQKDIQLFGVAANSEFDSIEELLEYAKANPGKIKIGGTSPGGLDDYMANGFAAEAGIEFTYVPYNSASETKAAVLGGEIDIYQDKVISFLTMVRGGDVKPLVVLNDVRLDMIEEFADVPSSVELGINFTQGSWRGFAVRKGTPQEIVDFLEDVLEKVYNSEQYRESAEETMSDIIPGFINAEDYGKMWVEEVAKFKEVLAD